MGIVYNKQFTSKDRRVLTSGPADRQRRQRAQTDNELIVELKSQVERLQDQLTNKPVTVSTTQIPSDMFTAEQVNDEIIKAIKEETANLIMEHSRRVSELNTELEHSKIKIATYEKDIERMKLDHGKEVDSLVAVIKVKEELIDQMRKNTSSDLSMGTIKDMLDEATRKLEETALVSKGLSKADIDPNRPKMDTNLIDPIEKECEVESHITVEDISSNKKEEMASKVDKLRNIMGKLPTKRS